MANENRDWSLQINVAGEQLFKPGSAIDKFADGPCEVTIVESWQEQSKGKNEDGSPKPDNIVFVCQASKGPDKDKKIRRYLTAGALEAGSIQRKEWKNLLSCVAKDPAALEKGNITIKPATFVGKTAFIFVQNPAETHRVVDGKKVANYANVNFITKDMVAELSAKPGAAKSAAAAGNGKTKEFEVEGGAAPQPEADALE